jgi:hypothetical protein
MISDRPTHNIFRACRLRLPILSFLALVVAALQTGSFLRTFVFA